MLSTLWDRFQHTVHKITNLFLIFSLLLLILLICIDVLARYLFNYAIAATYELEWHFFSLIMFLGLGGTFRAEKHVSVDLFFENFNQSKQHLIDIIFNITFLLPYCMVVIYYSFPYAINAYQVGEGSPDAGGLSIWWLIKFVIPIGYILLMLETLHQIKNKIRSYKNI